MKPLPPHITPTAVLAVAEALFHAAALRNLHAKCRNREIKKANIGPEARQETAVFVHELVRRLGSGECDDYCI